MILKDMFWGFVLLLICGAIRMIYCAVQGKEKASAYRKSRKRGVFILILGLFSLCFCWPLGFLAWAMGASDLRKMDANSSPHDNNYNCTKWGVALGLGCSCLSVSVVLICILIFAIVQ